VKAWLSRVGRPFVERNVEEDPEAYREIVALGWRTVPVTLVGGRAVKGFDPEALARALEDAG
jgi:glutaredoxin